MGYGVSTPDVILCENMPCQRHVHRVGVVIPTRAPRYGEGQSWPHHDISYIYYYTEARKTSTGIGRDALRGSYRTLLQSVGEGEQC